jgi:hypothetical protein
MNESNSIVKHGGSMLPVKDMGELATAGALLAESGMFGIPNAAAGFVVAATCHSQGISLMEFHRTYHIVEGKPSMRADAMLAEFRKRGGKHRIVENSVNRAAVDFEFEGQKMSFEYTMEDAKRTGDCYKGDGKTLKHTWLKRPEDMLWARLVSRSVRRLCPEINAGIYAPEEVSDMGGDEPKIVKEVKPISIEQVSKRVNAVVVKEEKKVEPVREVDYSVCPVMGELCGVEWIDMDNETLNGALESDNEALTPMHKQHIRKVMEEKEAMPV